MCAVTISSQFNGPRASGNGGYTAGLLAELLAPADPVQVRLRMPPVMDEPLPYAIDGDALTLWTPDGASVLATATRVETFSAQPIAPVSPEAARAVRDRYRGLHDHPFPTCFVCGLQRPNADGMELTPGALVERPDTTACVWQVPSGVNLAMTWAALDCPGGWSVDLSGRPMVLGTITAHIQRVPAAGQTCVVMGRCVASDDRKAIAVTQLWCDDELLGSAEAVWIAVDPAVFNALRA